LCAQKEGYRGRGTVASLGARPVNDPEWVQTDDLEVLVKDTSQRLQDALPGREGKDGLCQILPRQLPLTGARRKQRQPQQVTFSFIR